jgi:hypothetical protein
MCDLALITNFYKLPTLCELILIFLIYDRSVTVTFPNLHHRVETN